MSPPPASGGRLRVHCIVVDPRHVLAPGEIVWDAQGRIVRLARARRAEVDLCLLPGLVNAHVHLQLEPLRGTAPRAFVPWATAVMSAASATTPAGRRRRARAAATSLLREGTVAFGEIDSSGESLAALRGTQATGRVYRELTGFHLDARASRRLVHERRLTAQGAFAVGLSPHAPYSVSAELFAAARAAGSCLAVHCAETAEEQQFLRTGRGPFRDLLQQLGRLPPGFRAPGLSAVRWLERLAVLGPRTQLVHCQELERGDAARIATAGASVVVCPGTIDWFGRSPPPVPRWLRAGIPVALGTDSQASNDAWSLRGELQRAAALWPELAPSDLLAMVTTAGGRALHLPRLGRLVRGGRADLIAVHGAHAPERLLERFVHGATRTAFVVAAGLRVRGSGQRR